MEDFDIFNFMLQDYLWFYLFGHIIIIYPFNQLLE